MTLEQRIETLEKKMAELEVLTQEQPIEEIKQIVDFFERLSSITRLPSDS